MNFTTPQCIFSIFIQNCSKLPEVNYLFALAQYNGVRLVCLQTLNVDWVRRTRSRRMECYRLARLV